MRQGSSQEVSRPRSTVPHQTLRVLVPRRRLICPAAPCGTCVFGRVPGGRRSARAGSVRPQADRPCSPAMRRYLCRLAAGFRIGIATGYRFIRQAVDVLVALVPTLTEAVETIRTKAFVSLDGALLPSCSAARTRRTRKPATPSASRPEAVGSSDGLADTAVSSHAEIHCLVEQARAGLKN